MTLNRIISFLPSATEILYEIGAGKSVQAVTHRCTYPDDAKTKPKVITSPIDTECMNSAEIDAANSKMQHIQNSAFMLDEDLVRRIDPDLIISQNTCVACAAHTTHVGNAIRVLDKKPKLYEMNPHTVSEIIDSISDLARMVGLEKRGVDLVKSLRVRISNVSKKCTDTPPRVMILEWIDPVYTAGHWVPDMVEAAGGINLISKSGERSRKTNIQEIAMADPDIIIVMVCGFDIIRSSSEYNTTLALSKEWCTLRAVREDRVFTIDADSYASKPSHRVVTGIEILSKVIHPKLTLDVKVPKNSFAHL
ncbi:MAG: Iron siderophore/cobalamin periplasmic-binding domain-containing protein [Cenarchaeum symbiont of Oopsacas minuta]|nr:Iron siderophore/cobalamin periplasmic-binding domain-containing protein [Cenarchaeum symbiont of Oopsacas minuta]